MPDIPQGTLSAASAATGSADTIRGSIIRMFNGIVNCLEHKSGQQRISKSAEFLHHNLITTQPKPATYILYLLWQKLVLWTPSQHLLHSHIYWMIDYFELWRTWASPDQPWCNRKLYLLRSKVATSSLELELVVGKRQRIVFQLSRRYSAQNLCVCLSCS